MKFKCTNCGNLCTHTVKGEAIDTDEVEFSNGVIDSMDWFLYLTQCNGCGSVSLQVTDDGGGDPTQLFPLNKNLIDVPIGIHQAYEEAKKVKNISPIAFSILIRKGLDQLTSDKAAKGKDLNEKLKYLGDKEIIPKNLATMAHAIRHFGNLGAHDSVKMTAQDVFLLDELFLAIIEYVYIAPKKIEKARELFKQKKK